MHPNQAFNQPTLKSIIKHMISLHGANEPVGKVVLTSRSDDFGGHLTPNLCQISAKVLLSRSLYCGPFG